MQPDSKETASTEQLAQPNGGQQPQKPAQDAQPNGGAQQPAQPNGGTVAQLKPIERASAWFSFFSALDGAKKQETTTKKPAWQIKLDPLYGPVRPWDAPVQPAETIEKAMRMLQQYVYFKNEKDALIAVVWALFTHFHERLKKMRQQPFLNITSPEKGYGKTTLMELVGELSIPCLMTASVTVAALRRILDHYRIAVFLDEAKSNFDRKDDAAIVLRQTLNMAYTKRTAQHMQCNENQSNELIVMDCWRPYCVVGTRDLPGDTQDRCVRIHMAQPRKRLRDPGARSEGELNDWFVIKRQFARLAQDYAHLVEGWLYCIDLEGVSDLRGGTNYRPLLTIVATLSWVSNDAALFPYFLDCIKRNARERAEDETPSWGREAVNWIQDHISELRQGGLHTESFIECGELVKAMKADADAGWADFGRGVHGLSTKGLGRLLAPYQIKAKANPYDKRGNRVYFYSQFDGV